MGVVYRARDTRLDRDVALKLLPAGALSDEATRRRFRNEALALSKLSHPNIATVFDFDSEGGVDFLVMEYISGIILSEQLRAGALPEKDVVALAAQIAAALEEAHEHGIVHCDLKPSNVAVKVETTHGEVTLTGQVPSKQIRELAGAISQDTLGVSQVHNELALNPSVGRNVQVPQQ